jgi:hypothetical protein
MKAVYFNIKTGCGIETVDSAHAEDWPTRKEFKKEIRSMLENYHLAGMGVYLSQRPTKAWKNR